MSEAALAEDTFGHLINVELDAAELARKAEQHVEICNEIERIEQRKSEALGDFNKELKDKRKEESDLRKVINSKSLKIEVLCYPERDDRRGMMLTRRKDTGEVVDERALTAEERNEAADDRQGNLFDKPPAPPADIDEDDDQDAPADADTEAALEAYAAEREKVAAGGEPDGVGDDDAGEDDDSAAEGEE